MQNWKNLNVQNRLKYVCIALFHDQKLSLSFCGRKIAYWSHCTSAVYSLFFYARVFCQKAHSTLLTFGHYRMAQITNPLTRGPFEFLVAYNCSECCQELKRSKLSFLSTVQFRVLAPLIQKHMLAFSDCLCRGKFDAYRISSYSLCGNYSF